jgi:galactokinase/mevalonate kinase-like predicted kinase
VLERSDLTPNTNLLARAAAMTASELDTSIGDLGARELSAGEALRLLVVREVVAAGADFGGVDWSSSPAVSLLKEHRRRITDVALPEGGAGWLRLDLGMGGLADLPPVDTEVGAATVSLPFAVLAGEPPVSARGRRSRGDEFRFVASSLGLDEHWARIDGESIARSGVPIIPVALACLAEAEVYDLTPVEVALDSAVEIRAGLGGSGALLVAILSAVADCLDLHLASWLDIALSAEVKLGSLGGWEDLMAATVPRLTRFAVEQDTRTVVSERIPEGELERSLYEHLLLARTTGRRSGHDLPLSRLLTQYLLGNPITWNGILEMNDLGAELWQALKAGDLPGALRLSEQQWRLWARLTGDQTGESEVARLLDRVGRSDVLGAKLCGAGSAGYVLLFVDPHAREAVRSRLSGTTRVIVPQPPAA